jgi:hypothetical protein
VCDPCPALISLLDRGLRRQHHWWLGDGGSPQRIAGLLAAPLRRSDAPPRRFEEISQVFAPLRELPTAAAGPAAAQAAYRYLIRLRGRGISVCCWRRYGAGIGWQRRCGPMHLGRFLERFGPGARSAALAVHPADPVR